MKAKPRAEDLSKLPYEELYRRLEETVRRLELGDLSLEETLASYEQGMLLASACQALLDRADLRIQQVTGMLNGVPLLEPWEQ